MLGISSYLPRKVGERDGKKVEVDSSNASSAEATAKTNDRAPVSADLESDSAPPDKDELGAEDKLKEVEKMKKKEQDRILDGIDDKDKLMLRVSPFMMLALRV